MAVPRTIPPVPYKTQVVNNLGYFTEPWAKWFRDVFERIGGSIALSNTQLELLVPESIASLETDVATLQTNMTTAQASISSHTTSIATNASLINDILQGPNL